MSTETGDEGSAPSNPLAAELSSSVDSSIPGEDIDEPDDTDVAIVVPPLVQPAASRITSCLRAPCLKKSTEASQHLSTSPPSGHLSPERDSGSAAESSDEAVASAGSFAAIKSVVRVKGSKRTVHFDAAPPEAGVTHSQDQYDRRPIECTRRGEANDLSLPERGTCPLYTGDADDESGAADDDDEDEMSRAERLRGFARWSRLKNQYAALKGAASSVSPPSQSVSGPGKPSTLMRAANGGMAGEAMVDVSDTIDDTVIPAAAAADSEEEERNSCSQPFHGVRSFGRLSNRPDEPSARARKDPAEQDWSAESVGSVDLGDESEDREHEAFKQAVYAALSLSPNATPMPSPSVRPRWESVTSYFDVEPIVDTASGKSSGSTTPGPVLAVIDETGHQDVIIPERDPAEAVISSDDAQASKEASPGQQAIERGRLTFPLDLSRGTPSPSHESSTNASSPMSSRSSSFDTFSSPTESIGIMDHHEPNDFDSAFGSQHMPSFTESAALLSADSPPAKKGDAVQEGTLSSSSSSSSTNAQTVAKSSSRSTSPDAGIQAAELKEDTDVAVTPTRAPLDVDQTRAEAEGSARSSPEVKHSYRDGDMSAFFGDAHRHYEEPAMLSAPAIRMDGSHSAPVTAEHSPRVQSSDEHEADGKPARSTSLLAPTLMRRSSSGTDATRKTRKNMRRALSSGAPDEVHSDNATEMKPRRSARSARSSLASSTSSTAPLAPRSKSMSSAVRGGIKPSSFSSATFRSEIEDDGALGGF